MTQLTAITPELSEKIAQARMAFLDGKTITLNTHEDVERYFDTM